MAEPAASAITAAALKLLGGETIPYRLGGRTASGMDCQGLVAYCVQVSGGNAPWRDSNELARKYIDGGLIPIGKAAYNWKGYVGLKIDPISGGTPARYMSDAFAQHYGDCSHVGLITQSGDVWSVDASASAGKVRPRTKREAVYCWTHVAKLKGVDYDMIKKPKPNPTPSAPDKPGEPDAAADEIGGESVRPESAAPAFAAYRATVATPDGGTVRIRSQPTTLGSVWYATPANGEVLAVIDQRGEWSKARYRSVEGWVQSRFLQPV